MSFSIYRKTRSVRLTVTTESGGQVVVENFSGDQGFRLSFDTTRAMSDQPADAQVVALNLPPDALAVLESAQPSRADDLDALLSGKQLQSAVVNSDGDDALGAGFLIVEVEAGFDGQVSRIFRAIGSRTSTTTDGDDVTHITTIKANENLDGTLLGLPAATFPAGSSTFAVVDYLRRIAGLGPGNLTPASLTAILGKSVISSPYHVSGGQALTRIKSVLAALKMRWFVDDREIWVCASDEAPSPTGALPWVDDGPPEDLEPIIGRPSKDDGGFVTVTCLLCPRIRPGRLVRLTEDGLALAQQGLSAPQRAVQRAQVPPGLYRCESAQHVGTTGPGDFHTTLKLRPVVAPQVGGLLGATDLLLIDLGLG